jgi:hypothetical protein
MAKPGKGARQEIRCYLCGHRFEVSSKAMSVTCAKCNKAIKVEDIVVKSYVPVNDVQTCGSIKVTRRGRIAARMIQSGEGIESEGTVEGNIETEGTVHFGPSAIWKGKSLRSRTLAVEDGAQLNGRVRVPWLREEPELAAGEPAAEELSRRLTIPTG